MKAIATLLLPLCLALASPSFAVSLGDELILSRLGDPVEIEIEVLQWEDMDLDRVEISAATREEYEVFNLTWLPVLEDLNFNLVGPDLDGDVRVLVSSRDPLNEPFLELLLVLRWPGGSLRREYVLLFDPPGMALSSVPAEQTAAQDRVVMSVPQLPPTVTPTAAVDVPAEQVVALTAADAAGNAPAATDTAPPVADELAGRNRDAAAPAPIPAEPPAPAAAVEPGPTTVAETVVPSPREPVPPEPLPSEPDVADARTQVAIEVESLAPQAAPVPLDTARRTYQVRSGDSLWNIARQFRPAGAGENLYQMLLGIHNLNRNSFINGNISLLKANALLQMPTTNDIDAIDPLTAEAEFDRRWSEGTQRFDAVQRGEAIPLFANEAPAEEEANAFEEELPPGTEAPVAEAGESDLILVSGSDTPLPLQIATDLETSDTAPDAAMEPALADPPSASPPASESASAVVPAPPQNDEGTVSTVSRAALTAELETEVAAMRARRESAEALAQQLQASLREAQAKRAAEASLFSGENLLLAGSAAGLLIALVAGIVAILKITGELRLRRANHGHAALDARPEPTWMRDVATSSPSETGRREPVMPEMEVVELELPSADGASAETASSTVSEPDDLFARMENLLESSSEKPSKK